MKKLDSTNPPPPASGAAGLPEALLQPLRAVIAQARVQVLRQVDTVQVQTYWQIGRHIVEYEQAGQSRASYGTALLQGLGQALTREFGKGFDASNLRNMRLFYQAFPKCDALRHELSWTHYRLLLRVQAQEARQWYMAEAAAGNWSTRVLERHIGALYYERLLTHRGSSAPQPEAVQGAVRPRDFVRDPVVLEFLGLPDAGCLLESQLESALMDKLQQFLLELGKGFAFVGRQQRVSTETQDFYVDLVFYNYLLKCFVLIDLKTGHLTHQDIGQMDMYVRLYDDLRRGEGDNPTVGILLCGSKDASVVRYSVLHESIQLFASKYRLVLPSEEELRQEIERDRQLLQDRLQDKDSEE
ncbi:MAG TPA: PDDEXK nuclease domain-containing protein [Alicycliphilus sp.]|nr:PDDEXK nuclease domain-containing protein [Alicycliphilus sp.]